MSWLLSSVCNAYQLSVSDSPSCQGQLCLKVPRLRLRQYYDGKENMKRCNTSQQAIRELTSELRKTLLIKEEQRANFCSRRWGHGRHGQGQMRGGPSPGDALLIHDSGTCVPGPAQQATISISHVHCQEIWITLLKCRLWGRGEWTYAGTEVLFITFESLLLFWRPLCFFFFFKDLHLCGSENWV